MSCEPKKPFVPGVEGSTPPASAPHTGEGASTALEALIRKRKQVEGPEPPDGGVPQPVKP